MVIPGVLLQPIQQKAARVELLGLPSEFAVKEDEEETLRSRSSTAATSRRITVWPSDRTLASSLDRQGELAPGKREVFHLKVLGAYQTDANREPIREKTLTTLTVQLGHAGLDGKMQWPNYGRETVE